MTTTPPLRILLVEDSEHDVIAFSRALDKGGLAAEVTHFLRAEEALESLTLSPAPYDLVVADYKLPGITGLELCKHIISQKIPLPCIIVTGAGAEHVAVEALKAGVFDYLVKDFQQNYLQLLPLLLPEVVDKYRRKKISLIFEQERQVVAAISELFLANDQSLDMVYEKLPQVLATEFAFPISTVMLLTEDKKEMIVRGITGIIDQDLFGTRLPLEQTACCATVVSGRSTLTTDIGTKPDLHCFLSGSGIETCLSIPIRGKEKGVIGTITLGDVINRFDADIHIPALQVIANHLGQEIERKRVEEKLQISELWLKSIYNSLDEAVFVVTPDRIVTNINRAGEVLFGYSPEEICSSSTELLHVDHQHYLEFGRLIQDAFADNRPAHFEFEIKRKNGEIFLSEHTVSLLKDEKGKPLGIVSVVRDITERKQAEQALRESEERFRNLFENKHAVMLVINPDDGAIMDANPAASAYYGWSIKELMHKNIGDINTLAPDQVHAEMELARSEKRNYFIFRHRRAHGKPRDVEVYSGPIQMGEQVLLYSIVIDITQRRQAEEQLRRAKEEWEHTFDAMSDIITIQDKDMHIIRANKAAHEFFQVQYGELNGKHCYEVFTGVSAPCPGCPLVETLQEGKEHSAIITHEDLGKIFQVSSAVVLAENGDIAYIVHVARDITEQKKMEEELFQAHKMEAMGTLAGGIAHDFNNILSAIIGFSELAKQDLPENSSAGDDIDEVIRSSVRAADLVKQILAFSRKSTHQLQSLLPHSIIKEAMKMLRASLPTTLSLEEKIAPDCGAIMADPTNIHQIVVNLCTNAFHAMENEKGTLTVSLCRKNIPAEHIYESDVSPGPYVVLSVSDTGQGMDKKTIERIFEPYFTTKEIGKGSGLGLAVIHGIVKSYKGFIQVESELGKGSIFHVYFPALEQVAAIHDNTEDKPLSTGTERILVVDDESVIVNLHKTVLGRLGYTATATTSSKEALEKIRLHPDQFDLLITDQTMPELSGVELAEEVLKIKPNMPIILCTGYSSMITEEGALAIGIRKYARKPVDRSTLARIVRQVLDDNQK